MNILYKNGAMFTINDAALPAKAKKTDVKVALYTAIYDEFLGASVNPTYKNFTSLARFNALNTFAENWLKEKGYL